MAKAVKKKREIKLFDTITAKQVAIANTKLYVNREEGFLKTKFKKDEFLCSVPISTTLSRSQSAGYESGESG